jgi:putative redox protein
MTIQAQLKWVDGLQFVARADGGPALVIDNSENAAGPSPMEFVLMGVAGCTGMDVISIMQKKRANVSRFEVTITGERAEEHPKRYTHILVEYVLYGHDIQPKAVERAIELSETKYCSAIASLNARFEHSYRIVEETECPTP